MFKNCYVLENIEIKHFGKPKRKCLASQADATQVIDRGLGLKSLSKNGMANSEK